jgi:hypothetical protein
MKLVYYRKTVPNFGDDLNLSLWPALAPRLFDENPASGFIGIGTIIGMPCDPALRQLTVFSSGAGYDRLDRWADRRVEFSCVRGPITARLLGLPADRALTDGAILTPLAPGFPGRAGPGRGIVVVPHWETLQHPGWDEVATQTGFEIVDPRGSPEAVVARIADAALVLTESLHGAILADTYGIPWIAFATSRNFGVTKWVDWTHSVGEQCEFTIVPPPDPGPVLAFGRRPEPAGTKIRFGAEEAVSQFAARVEPSEKAVKFSPKAMIKKARWLRPFLGYSPARTAEALSRLATTPPVLSQAPRRELLMERMLERLQALARENS